MRLATLRLLGFFVAMPLAQLGIYLWSRCGLPQALGLAPPDIADHRVSLGIMYNAWDSLSYAAWAQQNRFGHYGMSDLYTTLPHVHALFNPYYAMVGILCRWLNQPPIGIMVCVSIAASLLTGILVYRICRDLTLANNTAWLASILVMFGSGPSWILFLVYGIVLKTSSAHRPFFGIDAYYFEEFPATTFLAYPYHAASLACLAAFAWCANLALIKDPHGTRWRIVAAAFLGATTILVRPYEASLLCLIFPISLYANRHSRGWPATQRYGDYIAIAAILLPVLLYIGWITQQPVWRDFAHGSLATAPARSEMLFGFSILWIGAAIGVQRAVTERQSAFIFLAAWGAAAALGILVLGGAGGKFAGGAVLAYGILAAYGMEGLKAGTTLKKLATASLLSILLTSAFNYASIAFQTTPRVDVDIAAAAARIRQDSAASLPTVLTDCATAYYLPGLAGARVYAGHWSLTPGYAEKCTELTLAGLGPPASNNPFQPTTLQSLITATKPRYIVTYRGNAAETWLLAHSAALSIMTGDRFSVLKY